MDTLSSLQLSSLPSSVAVTQCSGNEFCSWVGRGWWGDRSFPIRSNRQPAIAYIESNHCLLLIAKKERTGWRTGSSALPSGSAHKQHSWVPGACLLWSWQHFCRHYLLPSRLSLVFKHVSRARAASHVSIVSSPVTSQVVPTSRVKILLSPDCTALCEDGGWKPGPCTLLAVPVQPPHSQGYLNAGTSFLTGLDSQI